MTPLVHECRNGKSLIVCDSASAIAYARGRPIKPCVVLITTWSLAALPVTMEIAKQFIDDGCKFFVCAGRHAEVLHDLIDDLIVEGNNVSIGHVSTSFHQDDTLEDIVDFFGQEIDVSDRCVGGLVAILDDIRGLDARLCQLLLDL